MVIRGASLVDRFYTADGWTRSKVANLITSQVSDPVYFVIPRYFDRAKDDLAKSYVEEKYPMMMRNKVEFADCDYFAIYDSTISMDITGHDYIPFRR